MNQDLFDKIKSTSENASVTPSPEVWDRLEQKMDAVEVQSIPPPTKTVKIFSFRKWSIAASVLILVGAYGVLNYLGNQSIDSTAIQLEDLHTLEVNPRYNVAPVGESSTIPSIHMARSINTTYKGIDEGGADKKLKLREGSDGRSQEYGLG